MIKLRTFFLLSVLFVIISSCATKGSVVYFQKDKQIEIQNIETNISSLYELQTIQKYDILKINVSAQDITSLAPFTFSGGGNQMTPSNLLLEGYNVNEHGKLNLPLVGDIYVLGLTTSQAALLIQEELSKLITAPIVNVSFLNFQFTILGEVKRPGTFTVYNPKINIIQALGLAGDITLTGRRENIKIIREIDGTITTLIVDITKSDFIGSDAYYLKMNDIIYVEPNFTKITNSGYIGPLGSVATFVSLLLSVLVYSQSTN